MPRIEAIQPAPLGFYPVRRVVGPHDDRAIAANRVGHGRHQLSRRLHIGIESGRSRTGIGRRCSRARHDEPGDDDRSGEVHSSNQSNAGPVFTNSGASHGLSRRRAAGRRRTACTPGWGPRRPLRSRLRPTAQTAHPPSQGPTHHGPETRRRPRSQEDRDGLHESTRLPKLTEEQSNIRHEASGTGNADEPARDRDVG